MYVTVLLDMLYFYNYWNICLYFTVRPINKINLMKIGIADQ